MKVYSWNIFFRNTDFDRAFRFIEQLDFDVLCLQEVPESFLERLSKLNVHVASAPDVDMREIAPSSPTIVCGDFNILDTPLVSPFNWLLGGRVSDALRWRRERREIESRFAATGFVNPLRGRYTHIFGAQLDHILVSPEFSVISAKVERRWIGSDHYPVSVELGEAVANVV